MEQKLGTGARVAILAAALIVFIVSWGVFFAVPLAPLLGFGPALFAKILAVILASQALGCAITLALTGSPKRAWRALSGGTA